MGADRRQVGTEGPEVDRHPPGGLCHADVHEHPPLAAGGHDLGDRLDRAHLVVPPLQVDEGGVRTCRVEERLRFTRPTSSTPIDADRPGSGRGLADRGVLDGRHHLAGAAVADAEARGRDRLGRPAREDHLPGPCAEGSATASRASSTATPRGHALRVDQSGSPVRWSSQRTVASPRRWRRDDVDAWSR